MTMAEDTYSIVIPVQPMGSASTGLPIAIVAQKDGAGKTTLDLNLTVAWKLADQPAAVIDLDSQASAAVWFDHRETYAPVVVLAHATRLHAVLTAAEGTGAALTLIDSAPSVEAPALAAVRAADLVLVPCRASVLDLRAVEATLALVALAGTPAALLHAALPPSAREQAHRGNAIGTGAEDTEGAASADMGTSTGAG